MPATYSGRDKIDIDAQKYLPRVLVSLAASAAGIAAVDGGYYFVDDLEGLRADAETARTLGFDGKATLSTDHVDVINSVFGPVTKSYRMEL